MTNTTTDDTHLICKKTDDDHHNTKRFADIVVIINDWCYNKPDNYKRLYCKYNRLIDDWYYDKPELLQALRQALLLPRPGLHDLVSMMIIIMNIIISSISCIIIMSIIIIIIIISSSSSRIVISISISTSISISVSSTRGFGCTSFPPMRPVWETDASGRCRRLWHRPARKGPCFVMFLWCLMCFG